MKKKIIIIILVSSFITYFIYFNNKIAKINLTALGDGVSSGETSYNIDGISYNEYLKEYFYNKKVLKKYNNTYAIKNYKLNELLNDINNNVYDLENDIYINQILYKSNIITISFGEDELTKLAMTNDLNEETIKTFLNNYDKILSILTKITESKIVVLSLYENNYLNKSNVIIINSELANISKKYDLIFINVSDLLLDSNCYLNEDSYYFSYKCHEDIAKIIIHSL